MSLSQHLTVTQRQIALSSYLVPTGVQGNFYKLMDHAVSRHKSAIRDLYIPGEKCSPSYDRVISEYTIMRDMCMLHEVIVIPDYGRTL